MRNVARNVDLGWINWAAEARLVQKQYAQPKHNRLLDPVEQYLVDEGVSKERLARFKQLLDVHMLLTLILGLGLMVYLMFFVGIRACRNMVLLLRA